jgi:hypothetical protein
MTAEQFTYWLQGFMEICNPETLDENQTQIIKDHLKLVFDKKTPDRTITMPGTTTPFPQQFPTNPFWQEPHRINPFDVTCTTQQDTVCETSEKPKKSKQLNKVGPTIYC